MLYVNGRFLTQPMTGVNRYAYHLCKTMSQMGIDFIIVCPKGRPREDYDTQGLPIKYFGTGSSHFWEQCVLPWLFIGKRNHLLLSFTGLGPLVIRRKVMTIHDVAFLRNPSWYSRAYAFFYRFMTPLAIRTSRHILTVSQFSKQELMYYYPFLDPRKISVVYNAADKSLFRRLPEQATLAKPFALAVSSIDPRKNFARLIEAFRGIKDARLYIVGNYNRVFSRQESLTVDDCQVSFLGRISDEQLISLYNQASCFLFPSLYEGFGLPPLEAMSCGCPVLASDIPVIHEVCGDAALYFNPNDTDDMHNAIENYLALPPAERQKITEKGYKNCERFSWQQSVSALLHAISPFMGNHTEQAQVNN